VSPQAGGPGCYTAEDLYNASIAPTTRASYRSGYNSYTEYCKKVGLPANTLVQQETATAWAVDRINAGLAATTVENYASALHWHHVQRSGPGLRGPLPLAKAEAPYFQAVIQGALRLQGPSTAHKSLELIPTHIEAMYKMLPRYPPDRHLMLLASASLAVYGGLRPGEVLGSTTHPERRLRTDQLTFFSDRSGLCVLDPTAATAASQSVAASRSPVRCDILLHKSKTDQGGKGVTKVVAAPSAVDVAWRWRRRHAMLYGNTQEVFLLREASTPISWETDVRPFLVEQLGAIGVPVAHLTAKCFRRGFASAMLEAGAEAADWQASAAWAGRSHEHYEAKLSKDTRAATNSHRLGLAASAAATNALPAHPKQ
jgi:integrase